MKATISSISLLAELKRIAPVMSKNPIVPIIASVKMEFDKNSLVIHGTNLGTTIVSTLECSCSTPFSFVIDFSDIMSVCSAISEPITISLKSDTISITSSASKFKYSTSGQPEDFPMVPEEEAIIKADVDGEFFFAITNASKCMKKDELTPQLAAVCLHFKKNNTTVIGVDGMVMYKHDFAIISSEEVKAAVNLDFVNTVKNFQNSTVSITANYIIVDSKSTVIKSRLREQKFVDYESVLPSGIDYNLKISIQDFKRVLSISAITSAVDIKMSSISFSDGEIVVKSANTDHNKESSTSIVIEHKVEPAVINVNTEQMLNVLGLFTGEFIDVSFGQPNRTIYIKPDEENYALAFIRPLFIN